MIKEPAFGSLGTGIRWMQDGTGSYDLGDLYKTPRMAMTY